MKRKRTLAQKILMVAFVPLIFEMCLIAMLMLLLDRASQQHGEEAHAGQVVAQLNKCVVNVMGAGLYFVVYQVGRTSIPLNEMRQCCDSMQADTKTLEDFVANDRYELKHDTAIFSKAARKCAKRMEMMSDPTNDLAKPDFFDSNAASAMDSLLTLAAMHQQVDDLISAGSEIAKDEIEYQYRKRDSENTLRTLINAVLFGGVFASISISIGVAVSFNRSIVKRIARLRDNTMRFSRGEEPQPPMKGDDEIAELDKAFASMLADLRETRRREGAIINDAADVICTVDGGMTILTMNRASSKVWKYEPEEMIGHKLSEFVEPSRAGKLAENFTQPTFELQMIRADGGISDVLWKTKVLKENGTIACVCHDLSEKKRAERFRAEFVEALQSDLRSPLEEMQQLLQSVGATHEELKSTVDECARLTQLIGKLTTSEEEHSEKQRVKAAQLLTQSMEAVRRLAEDKEVSLVIQVDDLAEVVVDRNDMVRVIINLLGNAIKFSPNRSQIEIRSLTHGHEWRCEIADEGPGIPADQRDRIFESFRQVVGASSTTGSGIGLAFCKECVERHGGTLSVECPPTGGSVFSVCLPLPATEAER